MPIPKAGEILIRAVRDAEIELVDVVTLKRITAGFVSLPDAVAAARARNPPAIWYQEFDDTGRPLCELQRLPDLPHGLIGLPSPSDSIH